MTASHGSFFSRKVFATPRISSGPASVRCDCMYPNVHSAGISGSPVMRAYSRMIAFGSRVLTTKTSSGRNPAGGAFGGSASLP